jgi:hypothetical protein
MKKKPQEPISLRLSFLNPIRDDEPHYCTQLKIVVAMGFGYPDMKDVLF